MKVEVVSYPHLSPLLVFLTNHERAGYSSSAAEGLRDILLSKREDNEFEIHSRVLGNVLYLMTSMNPSPKTIAATEQSIRTALKALDSVHEWPFRIRSVPGSG